MTSHLGILILFSVCVSVVFGALLRDEPTGQIRLAARIFTSLVVGALAVGWLMFLIAP